MTASSEKEIKLAIIGCGAVVEERYLPAIKLVPNLALTHVVDLDRERAQDVADRFQIPNYADDYHAVFEKVHAAVVATPPKSHARISVDCLSQGLHVLCEKPLATSVEEAQEMIAASQQTHTHLAVGMIRRLSWSSQLLKRLVQSGMLGEICRIDVEEGGKFKWPLRTGHVFQDSSSGGVLTDAGSHVFDLLLWSLGSQRAQLVSYKDDNWGGVEANAIAELAVEWHSRPVPGRVELSFTRGLRNTLRIYGERGYLEAPTLGGPEVFFYPDSESAGPVILKLPNAHPRKRVEEFAIQLSNFADSIVNNSKKYAKADEVLATISIIEQCHRSRERMVQPWEEKHLESFFEGEQNGQ
jgi:UDP-N-acetylglucosamine 3-dehydrogenase